MAVRHLIGYGLGFSPGSTSLIPTFGFGTGTITGILTTPTLAVVDLEDGTGATATVTTSTASATNNIWYSSVSDPGWTLSTHRLGDGDAYMALEPGYYFAQCVSTLGNASAVSNVVLFAVTDGSLGHQFTQIILAIQARLITNSVLPSGAVKIVVKDTPPRFVADHDILIRPRSFLPIQSSTDGAGRRCSLVRRKVTIIMRSRLELDESDQETKWLTDASLGHFYLEEKVINALQIFQPSNNVDEWYITEPMRVTASSDYTKDREDNAWGTSVIDFDVCYELLLDQAYQ